MSRWFAFTAFWLAATVVIGGCGPRFPATAPVSGRITYQGQPVTQGRIAFYPETGTMAQGEIQADGSYTLTTFRPRDGAMPGPQRVVIMATRVTGPAAPKSLAEELKSGGGGALPAGQAGLEWLVPEIYSERATSPLTAEVAAGRNNTCNFELK